jgi:addiction module HigA family antidote
MRPIHPGEILREEYLVPLDMSANALAQAIGVPANRISAIVAGERGVTADTALRLARAFGTTPTFWLNLQQAYELRLAELDRETAAALNGIRRLVA